MEEMSIDARIAAARARLAANIGELQQRVSSAREMVSPSTYLRPWLKAGAVATLGYLLVRVAPPKQLPSGTPVTAPSRPRPLLGSLVRFAATALAGALLSRVLQRGSR